MLIPSTVLELIGMVLLVIAAALLSVSAGLAVAGVFFLAVGVVGGRS